jgi:RND superfamily putative drug exporter
VIAAAVVLLISFGSALAMGLPIVTALFGIGSGLSLIALIGHLVPAPSFAPVVASLIGLSGGVDYALFIVTRFREALRAGATPESALVTAFSTAGRAVLFAGTTVIIAVLGLLVLRQPLMNGVAVAVAAACVLAGSLTLLPALLGFAGTRLAKRSRLTRRTRGGEAEPSRSVSTRVGVKPAGSSCGAVGRRHAAAAGVCRRRVRRRDPRPRSAGAGHPPQPAGREHAAARHDGLPELSDDGRGVRPGFNAPLIIAAKLPPGGSGTGDAGALRGFQSAVRATPGVARVTPPVVSSDRTATMMIAYPTTRQQDTANNDMVHRLRDIVLPQATAGTGIRAYVGGPNADAMDFADLVNQRLPWLIGILVGLSVLLLMVVLGSVTVAIKAAVMNLLSISAAYGVLTRSRAMECLRLGWQHTRSTRVERHQRG